MTQPLDMASYMREGQVEFRPDRVYNVHLSICMLCLDSSSRIS